jgi:hypothetical protein
VTRGLWGQRPRTVLVRRVDRPITAWGPFGVSSLPHLSLLLMPVGVWMEVELTPVIEQALKSGDLALSPLTQLKHPELVWQLWSPAPSSETTAPPPAPGAGKRKSRAQIKAERDTEACQLVARIEDYKKEHKGFLGDAFEALYQKLGRNSAKALKQAYYDARRRIKGK